MMLIRIKVSASGLEFDPEKKTTNVACPKCKAPFTVTLAQIQREETVTCKSCQTNMKLRDKDGSTSKAVTDINKAFDELRRAIEDLGR
jgi:predicted Zn finger-like uncharacterized protein